MFTPTETDFNLDRHLISFLQDSPFFAELSRYIRKVPTADMPTAAVAYDQKFDDLTLYWNPEFFASLSDAEVRGVLIHEFYHLVFQHLSTRRKTPPKMWNVATDLAINSIIVNGENKQYALPKGGLVPGLFPMPPGERQPTKEEKAAMPMASLIESFPHAQSSEWYFHALKEKAEKEKAEKDKAKEEQERKKALDAKAAKEAKDAEARREALRRAGVPVLERTAFTSLRRDDVLWWVNEEIRAPIVIGAGKASARATISGLGVAEGDRLRSALASSAFSSWTCLPSRAD